MSDENVKLTINGIAVEAAKGELVIDAAEKAGVYIPRFCYHHRMRPVGMCRMCIVDIDTGRGAALQPSCMIPVADGMVVDTESEVTKKAQDGVLEFLLVNHPLDCPVCDKGGECPLQDNAYAYGPGESRFVEEKRHYEKPIPISDLVLLDRERCILCDRCTRFADEVAGDTLIHFMERGASTEVNTFPDHPFASYFSGNTVQICPVGALTSTSYRFKARPWDVQKVESTCTTCAVGCGVTLESSRNRVLRMQGVDLDPVNWSWLCDKGRFGFEAGNSEGRLTGPRVRSEDATWSQALAAAIEALRSPSPERVAVLGGARLTNEAAYAWARLAKGVVGTDNVDCQLGDGLPAELVLGLPAATIDDACRRGGTVVVLAPDLKEELPVLFLRLRDAVLNRDVTVLELTPRATSLTTLAKTSVRYVPGAAATAVAELGTLPGELTLVVGRPSTAESAATIADAVAVIFAAAPSARVLPVLRRGNVRGALEMGLTPGLLPGRVTLDDGRNWFTSGWGLVPGSAGLDATGILAAAADGAIDTLVLLGADPMVDFPDHDLARRALERVPTVIAVDTHMNESVDTADVVLPAAGHGEVAGSTTNIEGRVLSLAQKVTPPGTARADWQLAAELATRFGRDMGIDSVDSLWAQIEELVPSHRGITVDLLRRAHDGIVVPLTDDQRAALDGAPVVIGDSSVVGQTTGAELTASPELDERPEAEAPEASDTPDAAEDEAPAEEPASTGPALPPTVTFRPAVATEVPAIDAYGLRLVATRTMYDRGTLVQHSPSLAKLAGPAVLRMNMADLTRLGLERGGEVVVTSSRGRLTCEAVPDDGVPRGAAALPVNHDGPDPAELIDATAAVTTIQVETAR